MPAAKKVLPDYAEAHPQDDTKVCCRTCMAFNALPEDSAWISRASLSGHSKGKGHISNTERRALGELREQRQEAATRAIYENAIQAELVPSGSINVPDIPRPQMISQPDVDRWMDEEDNSWTLDGMRDVVTWDQEDELVDRELEDFGEYAEQVRLLPEPETEDEDVTVPSLMAGLEDLDLEEAPIAEIQERITKISQESDWYPYASKTIFLLDLLDNLPRLRLSRRHLEMFLWVMKESGVHDVPSLYALRQTQEHVRKNCGGIPTKCFVSSIGNVLYMNNIHKIVANICLECMHLAFINQTLQDYANPQTAALLQHYPEETDGPISEAWQATRWKEMPPDLLTPMYRKGFKDYYVNELAELTSGEYVIPYMWIVRNKRMCADARRVLVTASGLVVQPDLVKIEASDLHLNYLDLKADGAIIFSSESAAFQGQMPNPLRDVAGGDDDQPYSAWLVQGNVEKISLRIRGCVLLELWCVKRAGVRE